MVWGFEDEIVSCCEAVILRYILISWGTGESSADREKQESGLGL